MNFAAAHSTSDTINTVDLICYSAHCYETSVPATKEKKAKYF